MIIFKKLPNPDNRFDRTTVTIETSSSTISELIEDFQDFLLACGYILPVNSKITLVEED